MITKAEALAIFKRRDCGPQEFAAIKEYISHHMGTVPHEPALIPWLKHHRELIIEFGKAEDAKDARRGERIMELLHPAIGPSPGYEAAARQADEEEKARGT